MAKARVQNITIVATFLSPGVTVGGSGFSIVGGKIVNPTAGPRVQAARGDSAGLAAGRDGRAKCASK